MLPGRSEWNPSGGTPVRTFAGWTTQYGFGQSGVHERWYWRGRSKKGLGTLPTSSAFDTHYRTFPRGFCPSGPFVETLFQKTRLRVVDASREPLLTTGSRSPPAPRSLGRWTTLRHRSQQFGDHLPQPVPRGRCHMIDMDVRTFGDSYETRARITPGAIPGDLLAFRRWTMSSLGHSPYITHSKRVPRVVADVQLIPDIPKDLGDGGCSQRRWKGWNGERLLPPS